MLAQYKANSASFSVGVNFGGATALSEQMHGYSNDLNSMAYYETTSVDTLYFQGGWVDTPSTDEYNALYVNYGNANNTGNIYTRAGTVAFVGTTYTDGCGSEGVDWHASSGLTVSDTGPNAWGLIEFEVFSASNTNFRIYFNKDSSVGTQGDIELHLAIPLNLLDLPEASRTRVETKFAYGTEKNYTLGGKSQYASLGVNTRSEIQINYELLRESEKDLLVSLYETQRGSTYPFIVRIDDVAYPVIFTQDVNVIEEQAGLYNVSLNMESL